MPAPENRLKRALAEGRMQRGVWLGLASPIVAEMAAHAGFDWCLIDGEHGPNDIPLILTQLQAMAGAPAAPVVRIPVNETHLIKQVLDLGVQTLLVPLVDTAAQAAEAARATRYPPQGIRGIGAGIARASAWSGYEGYAETANDQICLMVQAESRQAIDEIDAIAGTEGVDCVFVGPADLSASLGHPGRPDAPEVREAIEHAVARTRAAGKAAGIITFDPAEFAAYAEMGVTFLGTGADVTLLAAALRGLAASARDAAG